MTALPTKNSILPNSEVALEAPAVEANQTPKEIVSSLDRYIIGQKDAKKAVAIALRNRWRRLQLEDDMRDEILPKNIIMIGPTGVGKTEIARRIARLVKAPFIKVEASKFTEVGYVGRDVESIVRDLADYAVNMVRQEQMTKKQEQAKAMVEERLLDLLLPPVKKEEEAEPEASNPTRLKFREKLRSGALADKMVELDVAERVSTLQPPLLLIRGVDDPSKPPEYELEIHQAVAGSQYLKLPNAGHFPIVEQPDIVNRAIEEFLGKQQ